MAGAQVPDRRDPVTPGILAALQNQIVSVTATDSLFEDRVEVYWSNLGDFDVYYQVFRGATLLSVMSSTDSAFVDFGGDPGVTYSYKVKLVDVAADTVLDMGGDPGIRIINPPTSVAATDGTYDDEIRIRPSSASISTTRSSRWRPWPRWWGRGGRSCSAG